MGRYLKCLDVVRDLQSIGPAPQACRPRRLFVIKHRNYQASSAGEAVPWTAPRGRGGAWIDLGCWRWDPGTVVNSPISCSSLCDGRVDWFRVPTAAPAQASRGGQSGLLGAAASLLWPGCLSYKHCAPAGRRASFVCRFLPTQPLSRSSCPFVGIERRRLCCRLLLCHRANL